MKASLIVRPFLFFEMNIKINRLLEGAKNAKGITVVIDVFRASNTIISCLTSGVEQIIPVGEVKDAENIKISNPNYLLFGERGGVKVDGFDYGNSPIEASKMNLVDKRVILTTSAGSQGIVYSDKADEVIIGSFANSNAVVKYLIDKNPEEVTLLAIGNNATEQAVEDDECARYIKAKIEGEDIDVDQIRKNILESDGASRLRRLKQEDDLDFCIKIDISNIVPKYNRDSNIISK